MIINAYAVLDGFLSLLRLGFGLLVVALGVRVWWTWRQLAGDAEQRKALEDRSYLLFSLAALLLGLNIVSWPVFYLLLQSYISEWPGIMCIYGVTQIGAGSIGIARFLPTLVATLEATKLALVFLSGAWFVLYLVNRRTQTAPLTGRVLGFVLAAGLLAVADATVEAAYIAVPKKEEFHSGGCCTMAMDREGGASKFLPQALLGDQGARFFYGLYFAVNGAMVVALAWLANGRRWQLPARWLTLLLVAAARSVVINGLFLVDIAAARLIRLPEHRCVYDLVARRPEGLPAIALFLGGSFAIGWAWVAGRVGDTPEARPFLRSMVAGMLQLGFLFYLWSLAMMTVELALT